MATTRSKLYKNVFRQAFLITFPPDGFDPIKLTYNGKPVSDPKDHFDYYWDWITIITSFMRAPNHIPDNQKKPSLSDIGNNLIGWQNNKTTGRKWINGLKALPTAIYHLSVISINTVIRSPIKLLTELLPAFLSNICKAEAVLAYGVLIDDTKSIPAKIGNGLLFAAASLGTIIFEGFFIIGQAITSPLKGIDYCLELGYKIANIPNSLDPNRDPRKKPVKTLGGKILGGILACFSATVSAVAITAAVFFLSPVIVTVGTAIVGAGAASAVVIGTGAGIMAASGFVATLAGTWLSAKWDEFNHWYNRTDNAELPTGPVITDNNINHIPHQFNEGQSNTSSPVEIPRPTNKITPSKSSHSHKLTSSFSNNPPEEKDATPIANNVDRTVTKK